MRRRPIPTETTAPPAPASPLLAEKRSMALTKAVVRVAGQLGLAQAELGRVMGVSPSTVSRMFKQEWLIPEKDKTWELAALLVRIFRSLDALVGGNAEHVRAWFQADNAHLGGAPAKLVFKVEGLTRVAGYLDAVRGAA
ncbi:MAG TPA: XRE family transcriptional regulator [Polyangia bacterium]|nr:XRE family transcriptional regulator [Polyangia bacterium]